MSDDNINTAIRELTENACDVLFELYKKGMRLPGYTERNGKPFFAKIIYWQRV